MTTADQQARLDAAMGAPLPHCTGGSCRQGRSRCQTPEACALPDPEPREPRDWTLIRLYLLVVFTFLCVLALSAWPL